MAFATIIYGQSSLYPDRPQDSLTVLREVGNTISWTAYGVQRHTDTAYTFGDLCMTRASINVDLDDIPTNDGRWFTANSGLLMPFPEHATETDRLAFMREREGAVFEEEPDESVLATYAKIFGDLFLPKLLGNTVAMNTLAPNNVPLPADFQDENFEWAEIGVAITVGGIKHWVMGSREPKPSEA